MNKFEFFNKKKIENVILFGDELDFDSCSK